MADQVVGKAVYQTEVDPAGTTAGLAQADQQVQKSAAGAEQAYSKASTAGANIGKAVQVGAGIAAVGFGMMTQAAQTSEQAQGAFMAATGKSRAEAVAFTADMNGLRGTSASTGKSLTEIAAAGTQVAQQLGLTGKAGADATTQFLAFSRVTGQDAAGAVDGLSGALDAFGEPADRANGLMDQLIASNQKYGTDVGPSAVDALSNMAPALQAMGKGLDYGVGLLNLFESANIDASVGQKALNKAVSELPPGENFDSIIAKLGALEDPLARRTEAAKIFGDALGTKLANAIKPGMTSLDDFQVKTEDVQGTTMDTAASMDTAGDKARQWAEKAKAAFDGIAQSVGPLVSGMGAIVSGVGALSPQLTGKIAGLWDDVAKSGPVQGAVQAAGKVVGPLYSGALNLVDGVKSHLLDAWSAAKDAGKDAISAAGIAARDAYSRALDVAQGVKFRLQDAWATAKDAASSAIGVAGKAAGAAYGVALSAGEAVAGGLRSAWATLGDLARAGLRAVIDGAGKAAGLAYAGAAFVIDRLADAANVAWGFLEGAAEGAATKAGGVLGKLFGQGLSDNIVSTVTGAAGTIVGNLSGDLIKAVTTSWSDVKKFITTGTTGRLIASVGAASSALYAAGVAVVDALVGALQTAWKAVTSRVAATATAAGIAGGVAYSEGAAAEQGLETGLRGAWAKIGSSSSGLLSAVGGVGGIVGTAFGVGAVIAIGAYVLEHKDEIAGFFKPVGDAVDKIMALGGDTSLTEQQARSKLKGVADAMAAELGIAAKDMRETLQTALAEGIAHGLSPADAYTYAVAAGKDIGAGAGTTTAQTFEQKLKAAGLKVPTEVTQQAGADAGGEAGTAAAEAFAADWAAGKIFGPLSPSQQAMLAQVGTQAGTTVATGTLAAFQAAGIPEDIAQYLAANATVVDAGGKQMVDPAKQDLVAWATSVGKLVGGGVPEELAKQMAAGSGTVSNGVTAMLAGVSLSSSQDAVASLYERLNVPQQLAVQWATTGPFDLHKALTTVFFDTAHKIDPTLAQQILDAASAAGIIGPAEAARWKADVTKAATAAGAAAPPAVAEGVQEHQDYLKRLGTDMSGLLSDGLAGHEAQASLKDATGQLRQLITNGLDPSKAAKADALFAIGKKYMTEVQRGLNSEDKDTVDAARAVAIHGVNAIEDAGLTGGKKAKGLDRIGSLYMQLLQSGMSKEDARTALVAGGVASDTVDKLETWYPKFTTTGEQFSTHVATGITNKAGAGTTAATQYGNKINNLPWGDWGNNAGVAYGSHLASGINSTNFSGKIAHLIDQLKGFSPPRTGPIREAVLSATHVGEAYGDRLIDGIVDRVTARQRSLAQLALAMQPALARSLGTAGLTAEGSMSVEVRHLISLDLQNAPAGITATQVASMVQAPLDWDAAWQRKMDEAQGATGMRWVVPVTPS